MKDLPTSDELLSIRDNISNSFASIKTNPMDLNLLMEHIGLLSASVDFLLQIEAYKRKNAAGPKATSE